MTVIEVEGTNVQPLQIDSLRIFAGTRGSIQVSCSANQCYNRSTLLGRCMPILFSFHKRVYLTRL